MPAKFFCRTGTLAGSDHRIGEEATIGRGTRNTIVLADSAVSKSHARIAFDPPAGAYYLQDLDSTNGTRLDGVPVSGRRRLGDLHVVTLGEQHDFIFAILPDEGRRGSRSRAEHAEAAPAASMGPAAPDAPASAPAVAGPVEPAPRGEPGGARADDAARRDPRQSELAGPVEAAATRFEAADDLQVPPLEAGPEDGGLAGAAAPGGGFDGEAAAESAEPATRYESNPTLDVPPLGEESAPSSSVVLEVVPADGEPYRVTIGDGRHVLGRAKDCDIPIDDRTLSRRHAAFVVRAGAVTVGDLHSLNGTFMDGKPVEAATEVAVGRAVMFGDRVKVVRVAP